MNSVRTVGIGASELLYVSQLVHKHSAVTLDPGKEWFVESRLAPLVEHAGLASTSELIATLRARPFGCLHKQAIEALMTQETSFFRDLYPFEALQKRILPELIAARGPQRSLQLWSAACASGQEPYSLAMLIRDGFPMLNDWSVRILATDISSEMLERTRAGTYNQVEVNRGLPAAMLVKHFEKQDKPWRVNDHLRRMIELRQLNLAAEWPSMPSMDVIFLRNVLIYFDIATKKSILAKIRRLLRPDGYLVLGSAETTFHLDPSFEPVKVERTICYKLRGG